MGEKKIKRELLLEGLDCASCAAKIEKGVNEIQGVSSCSVNFVMKTMVLETKEGDEDAVITEAKQLVTTLEPHIAVKEKQVVQKKKQILLLKGLDCANCAAKIEAEVQQIPGVITSTVDFVTKKLIIEVADQNQLSTIVKQATAVVKRLEPDVEVEETDHSISVDHDHGSSEMKRMIIRLITGALLTGIAAFTPMSSILQIALFVIAYIVIGGEIVIRALKNIAHGKVFDENFLMAVATLGAFAIKEFPEAVSVLLFYQVGELFQSVAVNRSRKSISALMDIRPDYANLQTSAGTKRVSPETVAVGDIIIIKPGEKVPLDGKVMMGTSMMDTSALTGESVPRTVERGNEVLSGCINKSGVLTVEVTKEYGDSTVSKILDLVQNASSRKAPTENFITKFARYYTPAVVITAAMLAFLPPLVNKEAILSDWIYRALVFLVISCPCALVISIPLGFFGGIGGASKRGILIKGSNYLEALHDVKYVVFDKTGTLTKGIFEVTGIYPTNAWTEQELLHYGACAESYSNHPIAMSIQKAYGKTINEHMIEQYREIPGHGVQVTVQGREVFAGNDKLMHKQNIAFQQPNAIGTIVHIAIDGQYAGHLVISDEVKEDAAQAIRTLKELGVKQTIMLTGDAKRVGEAVGQELGLDKVFTELLPHQKVEEIERLDQQKAATEKIVFVGDGINDTPVLARADVGIAMGGLGSDAAIEAADVVIMTDEPSKVATAIKVAKHTRRIVWQNIIFALGVKGIVLLFGAFGIATMWEAVFSDVGVTVLAILNSMRVLRVDKI
ncbi:heavy metal translocating P-type ATPase [Microbacteriaceae bacterium 4G12]